MAHVTRTCIRCGLGYPAGTYQQHRNTCARGIRLHDEIVALVASGLTQAQVARLKGMTRQRVNAIVRGRLEGEQAA